MAEIPKVVSLTDGTPCAREFARGVARYSRAHGPWIFYTGSLVYTYGKSKTRALSQILEWGVSGFIVNDSEITPEMLKSDIPIIAVNIEGKTYGLPQVARDDERIGVIGAEHLLDRGFRLFAYSGLDDMYWSRRRGESFSKKIAEAGFKTYVYPQPASKIRRSWDKDRSFMVEWLKSLPKPVGIMACNDERGQYILDACMFAGLAVPYEVAVIGVDNDEQVCELANPPLSSIAVNNEMVGYTAAEVLDKMMAGEKNVTKIMVAEPTHTVTRKSTDILAVEDRVVAEAIQLIRKDSRRMIQVSDVTEAVGCSSRTLGEKFRRTLGCTIHAEIKRARVERIVRMLVDTDLPISRIACDLGFSDADHIARYVKQELGMSPLAYRRHYARK